MLIQSLVIIAAMVVLAGAILTSTLVTAKASLHQTLLAKTQTAMNDATQTFVAAAAANVRKYGTEQPWPAATPSTEALCAGASPSAPACPFLGVASWHVTGRSSPSTGSLRGATVAPGPASDAENLAATIDEQRISATIAVRVTDPTGKTLLADRSRQITARIFNASPYVVVTGSRDSASAAGSIRAAEGDTAGNSPATLSNNSFAIGSPIGSHPAAFIDTRLRTSVDCNNSRPNFDQANPMSTTDIGALVNHSIRPFGNQDWAYEAPCVPKYSVDTSSAPSDYATPIGTAYLTNPTLNEMWQKTDQNSSSFAR